MQIGMIGLGRMGGNMVRRLLRGGHTCVVWDRHPENAKPFAKDGATAASSLEEFVKALVPPRAIWIMIPAAAVESMLAQLEPLLERGDIVIDGGNSHYRDDIARAERLASRGLHYVDCGTSGGVWGLERGYCLMIGGEREVVARLDPVFATLGPGVGTISRTPARASTAGASTARNSTAGASTAGASTAERGYLHCGPAGAGHFVKMVHNGIEYGIMAAYAEGLNILKHANVGKREHAVDAETTPLADPKAYAYDFALADVAEVWRRGSVIASWLLDLTADELARSPELASYSGRVSDSGEGRWTVHAAVDEGVPAHVLTAALFARFDSRGQAEFQNRVLSAMRAAFGGHREKA
ncbi:MAG: phosphogluconate dehydrogenase (NAD(+)-dependent, decarboxylating) [Candidatus Eiseniibacteriota bacterium]